MGLSDCRIVLFVLKDKNFESYPTFSTKCFLYLAENNLLNFAEHYDKKKQTTSIVVLSIPFSISDHNTYCKKQKNRKCYCTYREKTLSLP